METRSSLATENPTGKQAETTLTRLSLLVSTTTSLTTLLVSFASDVVSTPWLLGSATLVCAICLIFLFLSHGPSAHDRRRRFLTAVAGACGLVLAIAWAFVYRDAIRFSAFSAQFRKTPAVLVADAVAGHILTSRIAGTSRDRRLIAALDDLVEEAHHTRVSVGPTPDTKGAFLSLTGVISESRFSLTLAAPNSNQPPALDLAQVQALDSVPELLAKVAGDNYFLASAFDAGPLSVTFSGGPQSLNDLLALSYRGVSVARASRESKATLADAHLAQFFDTCQVLGEEAARSVPWLEDVFLFAAHRALASGNTEAAAGIVQRGLALRPGDKRLQTAEKYLRFRRGDAVPNTKPVQQTAQIEPSDLARQETLAGLVELSGGAAWDAIRHFEVAAENANSLPDTHRFGLHLATALLLSEVQADPVGCGSRILKQTEAAEALSANVPLAGLLRGFGHALVGNAAMAEQSIEIVRQLSKTEEARRECDYWHARSLYALKDVKGAIAALQQLERSDPRDPRVLGLLAELNALPNPQSDGPPPDAEHVEKGKELAIRALKLNPNEARSHRVLGMRRAMEAAENRGELRISLFHEALMHLESARNHGHDDSRLYGQISWIQRELARAADSKLAARKVDEVACQRENQQLSCGVVEVRQLLERGDPDGAWARTNEVIKTLRHSGISDEEGNQVLVSVAVAWYEAGMAAESQQIYEIVRKNMSRRSANSRTLMSVVDCNEGFIFVDTGDSTRAKQLFRRGLQTETSADCEAGLAIALFASGDSADSAEA
ncbi:MAG TPA: hypothetical protein VHM25_17120, partial [Polyangiaceae bacterium]|nr:hypothetical protein [Polyangiaceae bacterium]